MYGRLLVSSSSTYRIVLCDSLSVTVLEDQFRKPLTPHL